MGPSRLTAANFRLHRHTHSQLQAASVFFNTPNLHFIPVNPPTSSFKNDVYVATSEPHGNIECTVTRGSAAPHITSKL